MTGSHRLRWTAAVLSSVLLGFCAWYLFWYSAVRDDVSLGVVLANFREVDPGRFFRSGQLDPDQLREVVTTFGIRTVVNLRGESPGKSWYEDEVRAARELGVAHHDVRLSSRSLPRPGELAKLLALYREASYPILVHCDAGADRSGEADALYRIEQLGQTPGDALEALSFRVRHKSWEHPVRRAFIERYGGEAWLEDGYDPCGPDWTGLPRPRICGGGQGGRP